MTTGGLDILLVTDNKIRCFERHKTISFLEGSTSEISYVQGIQQNRCRLSPTFEVTVEAGSILLVVVIVDSSQVR